MNLEIELKIVSSVALQLALLKSPEENVWSVSLHRLVFICWHEMFIRESRLSSLNPKSSHLPTP